MADLSAVESALVTLVAGALFTGTYTPGAYTASNAYAIPVPTPSNPNPTTAAAIVVTLYRGWPIANTLNADLLLSQAHVSVFSDSGMTRDVSRWQISQVQLSSTVPTVTATVSGNQVTIGGTVTAGNVVGIQAGAPPQAYAYAVQSADTTSTIAAALAAKLTGASASGPAITMPTVLNLQAAVMVPQAAGTVTRQQQQGIRVSIWAPTPAARDAIVSLIDGAIAGLKNSAGAYTRFFPVTAYESAKIDYAGSFTNDMPARDRVWRRDIRYRVEYCTTDIEQFPEMLFGGGTLTATTSGPKASQIGDIAPT